MPKVTKKGSAKKASPLLDEEEKVGKKKAPTTDEGSDVDADADTDESSDESDTDTEEAPKSKKTASPAPVAKKNVDKEMRSDIEVTRAALAKEEQVHFMIPLGIGEKAGAFEDVWINGFHTRVPKGRMSILPKSIADLLSNKYQVEAEAGEEFRLDLHPEKDVSSTS